ncbi:MAG TPA: TRIC cation channel family protein [Candidatus Binatia bacterium]|nr:TRIC cation channel family protein [Candidatus Binatia bacterium]
MLTDEFHLPAAFDLTATFLFAITGTLAGMRRHYDIIGVFAVAFATALGGGLIRDGVFISAGPPVAITNVYYLPIVTVAVLATILIGRFVPAVRRILSVVPTPNTEIASPSNEPQGLQEGGNLAPATQTIFRRIHFEHHLAKTYALVLSLVDALGLGIYAVVGVQKSLNRGLPIGSAILVGAVNAVGGGLLRDVLTREVPLLFKPGQFYALTAAVGSVVFVLLVVFGRIDVQPGALVAIGVTFLLRLLTIRFDWQSPSLEWSENEK